MDVEIHAFCEFQVHHNFTLVVNHKLNVSALVDGTFSEIEHVLANFDAGNDEFPLDQNIDSLLIVNLKLGHVFEVLVVVVFGMGVDGVVVSKSLNLF